VRIKLTKKAGKKAKLAEIKVTLGKQDNNQKSSLIHMHNKITMHHMPFPTQKPPKPNIKPITKSKKNAVDSQ
jgi:hypothetical protein